MKTKNQSFENFNEIVFEHRNKAYGAYALRKSYGDTVGISIILTSAVFGIIFLIAVLFSKSNRPKVDLSGPVLKNDSLLFTAVDLTRKKDLVEKPKVNEDKPKADNKYYKADDKPNNKQKDTNPENDTRKDGDPKGKDSVDTGEKIGEGKPIVAPKVDSTVHPIASDMPEFVGNLFHYLTENLRYPAGARENMTEGTVYISFVVEKDGSIGEIKTLKGVGDGCTEEAIRVVRGMPKWKPGKEQGELVRVLFNLPVKFRLK